jgi:hypothetical protein
LRNGRSSSRQENTRISIREIMPRRNKPA